MPIRAFVGFESGGLDELANISVEPGVGTTWARGGLGCRLVVPADSSQKFIGLPSRYDSAGRPIETVRNDPYTLGFAFRFATLPSGEEHILHLLDNAARRAFLRVSPAGDIILRLGTSINGSVAVAQFSGVVVNQWYYCELSVGSDAINRPYVLRINGQLVGAGTSPVSIPSACNRAYIGRYEPVNSANPRGYELHVDDAYVSDDMTFLGPSARVEALVPVGLAYQMGWGSFPAGGLLHQRVADIPADDDASFIFSNGAGATFATYVSNPSRPDRIAAVLAMARWRSHNDADPQPAVAAVGMWWAGDSAVGSSAYASFDYENVFYLRTTSPLTGQPWRSAELADVVPLVFLIAPQHPQTFLRVTQVQTQVLWYSRPPAQRVVRPRNMEKEPMNFKALPSLTATGSDQAVEVPRGATLIVRPVGANAEIRDVAGGPARLTIPADTMVMLGPSYGQTVYLRASANTVIELALT